MSDMNTPSDVAGAMRDVAINNKRAYDLLIAGLDKGESIDTKALTQLSAQTIKALQDYYRMMGWKDGQAGIETDRKTRSARFSEKMGGKIGKK